jgi:jouberin
MHPLVKVSIVDLETGELVTKSNKSQKVSSYYETEHVKHVVPLMTQPFEFRHRKSIVPRWEELLLFNDDFEYFVSLGTKLGVFFEILDFVSMSAVTNNQVGMNSGQGGWHHVAWAFLKPVPSKNYSNVSKRVRLQMYKPGNSPNHSSKLSFTRSISAPDGKNENRNIANVWYWWNKCQHIPYPSSLYVTIEPITPPMIENVQPALRSTNAAQPEHGSTVALDRYTNDDVHGDTPAKKGDSLGNDNLPRIVLWARLPGQSCRIPDKDIFKLDTLTKGSRCIVFSSDGRYLAASCPISKEHSVILIYNITNGELELTLDGHKGPIYGLHWHRDDYLLSASGDTTVKIWAPKSKRAQVEKATLEHPCYIYSAKFHPNSINLLATAGYDNVIRIWMKEILDDDEEMLMDESMDKRKEKNETNLRYVMKHELVSHKSYINCLVFDIDGQLLFSGDNNGGIRVWEPHIQESPSGTPSAIPTSKQMFNNTLWYLKKKLEFKELIGNPITSMHIHPGGRRLLIQCRSLMSPSSMLMIDLKLNLIMQTFSGIQSFRKTTGGCITPCGTYVFAGSQGKNIFLVFLFKQYTLI